MQYLYNPQANNQIITLEGDEHHYIFKVRRHKVDDIITMRNLVDKMIYEYQVVQIDKKRAILHLQSSQELILDGNKNIHIAWCIIEPRNIEKVLPMLNELGVGKITFVYCARSQNYHKLDIPRMQKIILNSSQQCGRSDMMELEILPTVKKLLVQYPDMMMLSFAPSHLGSGEIKQLLVGCEGGFAPEEMRMFGERIVGLDTNLILKSESATVAIATKMGL